MTTVDERLAEIEAEIPEGHTEGAESCSHCDRRWLIAELRRTRATVREALDHLHLVGGRCDPNDVEDVMWRVQERHRQAAAVLTRMLDGEQQGE